MTAVPHTVEDSCVSSGREAQDRACGMQECKSRKGHCVVIGASYIGMECGASVASNGIDGALPLASTRCVLWGSLHIAL